MLRTYTSILASSAAVLNDQTRAVYTDAVLLAYLNMALAELEEIFELNNIPVTNETSAIINVPAGITVIGYNTAPDPVLPPDLIEIQQLWESLEDQEAWTPVTKKEFLTQSSIINGSPIAAFGVWAWMDQEIHVLESNQDNDLKLDYIKSLFSEITVGQLNALNPITNTDTFLSYRVAGLAAEFIDENTVRADKLNLFGGSALERSLGISIKGKQSITTRRRPFRAAWKSRRILL